LFTSTFVGRTNQLRTFESARVSAGSGQPQVVLVDGPAGVGKSALVARFVQSLRDVAVISVGGDDTETNLRFGLVEQILGSDSRSWADPFAAGAAMLQFFGQEAHTRLLVVTVDDAHLADVPSLRAVNFTLRRLRAEPVLVVLTARDDQLHRLPTGLVQLASVHGARIGLRGLTDAEVVDLSATVGHGRLSSRAAARLRSHTHGSPLHLRALLYEVPWDDLQAVDRPLPAPHSFAHLVVGELSRTSMHTQAVASAAAVLGDGALAHHVLTMAGVGEQAGMESLEELERIRLLRAPPGGRVMFEHPLVRAAVYDDLGPATRSGLHQRAAQVLDGPRSLSHRVAAALVPDPALVSDLERKAEEDRAAGDPSTAAASLVAASRLSPSGPDADRLLLSAVELLLLAGEAGAAAPHMERLAGLAPSGRWLHVQARMAWLSGRAEDAVALGRQAWTVAGELDPGERDQIAALVAQIEVLRGRGAEAAEWATRALSDGRLRGHEAPQTRAIQANGLCTAGRAEQGLELLAWLPDDAASVPTEHHPELAARGILRMTTDHLSAAIADLTVTGSLSHQDFAPFRLAAQGCLAEAEYRSGNWTAARTVAEQALSLAEDMEQPWHVGFMHSTDAAVPAGQGDWAAARAHVDAACAVADLLGDPATAAYADNAAIFLATCQANPAEVVRLASRLRAHPSGTPHEPGILSWPPHLVAALVELGRLDEAEIELDSMLDLALDRGRGSRLAALARVRGQLAAARRDNTAAREAFEDAIRLGEGASDALEQGVAHAAYGRFLRRRGERRAAVEHLQEARRRFEGLRAAPFLERCTTELGACGVTEAGAATTADPLTPQERLVAELACGGRTNQQVAEELVVSVKTVGYHLSNVYMKLGVHSRAQLVTQMRGLDPPAHHALD
jgi:ATP/maltotriose-dependent transcriptional regulator MalT